MSPDASFDVFRKLASQAHLKPEWLRDHQGRHPDDGENHLPWKLATMEFTCQLPSAPGATLTERTLQDDPEYEKNWASVTPDGRVGYVEDIVAAASISRITRSTPCNRANTRS